MGGKKFLYVGIAVLVLGIGFAIGTYAYYQTTVTGQASGTVLYWDCNTGTSTTKATFADMYPGSNGTITFNLKCSIDADYTITLNGYQNIGAGGHPNLKLYKAKSGTNYSSEITSSSTAQFSGSITGGTASQVVIYYNWPYGTTREDYSSAIPAFNYTITYKQKQ